MSNYGFSGEIPSGASMESNVNEALEYQQNHTSEETLQWFYDKVRNNAKENHLPQDQSWDYKQTDSKYEDFGNFNYALVGKAIGFSDLALEYGAGVAQGEADGLTFGDAIGRSLFDPANKGDNPGDQQQIKDGIQAAEDAGIGKYSPGLHGALEQSLGDKLVDYLGDLGSAIGDAIDGIFSPADGDGDGDGSYRIVYYDPLTLDLDGDGLETVSALNGSGVMFDGNNNGIRTTSGWIKGDDGLLVRDVNGNGVIDSGAELFGDSTLLNNGETAENGFAALTDLDSNMDGKVDIQDTAFNELKVWRDINQDGQSQAEELFTLDELGIESLNTQIDSTSAVVLDGGIQKETGTFTRTDGTVGDMADVDLMEDTFRSQYVDSIEIPPELQNLPDIAGMGRLWEAA